MSKSYLKRHEQHDGSAGGSEDARAGGEPEGIDEQYAHEQRKDAAVHCQRRAGLVGDQLQKAGTRRRSVGW